MNHRPSALATAIVKGPRSALVIGILSIAVVALLVTNTFLVVRVGGLKQNAATLMESERSRSEPVIGQAMPIIEGVDAAGQPLRILFGEREQKTLLFVFAAECGACTANWPRWQRIRSAADPTAFRTVFVDVTGSAGADYFSSNGLESKHVLRYFTSKVAHLYRFSATPQLVLLDPGGRVLNVWTGGMTQKELAEVVALVRGETTL